MFFTNVIKPTHLTALVWLSNLVHISIDPSFSRIHHHRGDYYCRSQFRIYERIKTTSRISEVRHS